MITCLCILIGVSCFLMVGYILYLKKFDVIDVLAIILLLTLGTMLLRAVLLNEQMTNCSQCHYEMKNSEFYSYNYCPQCNYEFEIYCNDCGKELEDNSKNCPYCGKLKTKENKYDYIK